MLSRAPFQNAGIAIYNYLYEYGHLERDHDTTQELLKEWEEATLLKVCKGYHEDSLFIWLDWITNKAEILNKGARQIRKKFLNGLPESFDPIVAAERIRGDNGTHVFPANFPAHHPNAGNPDPRAGEPRIPFVRA